MSDRKLWKYSGAGNTFVLADARREAIPDPAAEARRLCAREGVDGLLVMDGTPKADIRMRIFNPDGSEAEMCGNGSRCAAHWAHHDAGIPSPMTIETGAGVLKAEVKGDSAKIRLTDPHGWRNGLELDLGGRPLKGYHINTGVPHTVIPVDRVSSVPVEEWGRKVRNDAQFKPKGTNVCFLERTGEGRIDVRTYERGVEGETQACGTGASACALVSSKLFSFKSPVLVHTASGDTLKIHFKTDGDAFTDVYLEGPVRKIN